MMGYQKVNLSELLSGTEDAEQLHRILSDFSCPYNKDVEDFLHTKAIEFTRQGYSATYLIFASYQNHPVLVGYFALAPKFFHINLKNTSKTLGKRIRKFARYDEGMKRHLVSSILIGQLGKNYTHGYDALIRGTTHHGRSACLPRVRRRALSHTLLRRKRILIIRYARVGRRRKGRILRQISHSDGEISEVNCEFRFEHSKNPPPVGGGFYYAVICR